MSSGSKRVSQVGKVLNLSDEELDNWIKQLGFHTDTASAFLLHLTDDEWYGMVDSIRESVRYTNADHKLGMTNSTLQSRKKSKDVKPIQFDTLPVIDQFLKKVKEDPAPANSVPTLAYRNIMLHSKNDFKTDLVLFISVFLETGNNINKALLKCDGPASDTLRRKARAYGLVINPEQNKTVLGPRQLTLARISQAFSEPTAAIIIKRGVKGKWISKLFSELPILMQYTVFPQIIPPKTKYTDQLKKIAVVLNMEMSILLQPPSIKRKMLSSSVEEMLKSSTQFVDAAMSDIIFNNDDGMKTRLMINAGIIVVADDRSTKLSDVTLAIYEKASQVYLNANQSYRSLVSQLENVQLSSELPFSQCQ